jgi:hypothetical protein
MRRTRRFERTGFERTGFERTGNGAVLAARGGARTLLALLVLGLGLAGAALAGVGDYRVLDESKVYFGNSRLFQKPATVDCDRVYAQISEYQEILRKGLTDKDPRYHFLIKKASERFSEAVKSMAKDAAYGHDLVAAAGSVQKEKKEAPEPPDRTQAVIGKLN